MAEGRDEKGSVHQMLLLDEQGNVIEELLWLTVDECTKSSFKDSFPLLYKAAEELDAAVGEGLLSDSDLAILEKGLSTTMTEEEIKRCKKGLETTLLMKREFNELVQSKKAFTKLSSSGFCVTLSGSADGSTCSLTAEAEIKKIPGAGIGQRKVSTAATKEIRNRMRKTLVERQGAGAESTGNSTKASGGSTSTPVLKVQQGKFVIEEISAVSVPKTITSATGTATTATGVATAATTTVTPASEMESRNVNRSPTKDEIDVDQLVQLIEGTQIKNDPNPKKAAKKARQKEKKEQERLRLAEEQAREERKKIEEEKRRQAEIRRKEEEERRKKEEEERRQQEDILRKQKETAEQRKEEQRRKRQEAERKKQDEKKLKKEAKKQRREQRKKDLEQGVDLSSEPSASGSSPQANESQQLNSETRNSKGSVDKVKGNVGNQPITPEKEYGRLKHEKEQRKREEEDARRLEQLQAQERVQATKKNKKKKKKSKQLSDGNNENVTAASQDSKSPMVKISAVGGKPLIDVLNEANQHPNSNTSAPGKSTDEKSNLVTIRKHMDSTVTISMRGKEGEKDLVYTLLNGQVYPTNNDGRHRIDDPVSLQQTGFARPEFPKPTYSNMDTVTYMNPTRNVYHSAPTLPSYLKETTSMQEIDLTQLKLPPGITITRVPQNVNVPTRSEVNGVQNQEYYSKGTPSSSFINNDYQRQAPVNGGDHRFNASVMVVDSRCSSLESPVTGIRNSDMIYGTNGTRPSSEASIASDRPSSGLDSICNNGTGSFMQGTSFHSNEAINKHVPISMTSPFTAASRNETPSPGWQHDIPSNHSGLPTMTHSVLSDRHGLWSSTPASPVSFPPNAVPDSYLRAQDHQFIKPRPQQRSSFVPNGKPSQSASDYNNDKTARMRASYDISPFAAVASKSNTSAVFLQEQTAVNGSSSPSPFPNNALGQKSGLSNGNVPLNDPQWSPWNPGADRFSPEIPIAPTNPSYYGTGSFSLHNILKDDANNIPWESTAFEKPAHGTNPFGPIGSNITRRSSATSGSGHGSFDKIAEAPTSSGKQQVWAYNPAF